MNARLASVLAGALSLRLAAPTAAAICAPATLFHIAVANVTPGIAAGSFAAQPKNYYRIGSDRLRVEEALDAANGIQGIFVISEPNIWMANLYNHTGRHIVDPGPTFFAKAPIFGTNLSGKLIGLEFGCEAEFIAANPSKPAQEQVGGVQYDVYRFEDGADAIAILERAGTTTPAFARYYRNGTLAMALRYDLYSAGLPNDPSLFSPPPNVQYAEGAH